MGSRQGQREEAAGATPLSGEGVGRAGLQKVVPFTSFIFGNEKAYSLIEADMTPYRASRAGTTFTPDSYVGLRRYQIIGVNRSGHIALWMHDMGPAEDFRFGSLQVLALWEETVDWVQNKALEIREKDAAFAESVIKERQAILKQTWPLIAERQIDLLKKYQNNQSTFGPHVRVERN